MKSSSTVYRTLGTLLRLAAILLLAAFPLAGFSAQDASAAPAEKPLQDAPPLVSLQVPATAFIGENVNFTVTFDNSDTVPGYGPLIDLVIPRNGADGAPSPDGLSFVSATYLGSNIENTVIAIPASGCVAHPYMMDGATQLPLQVCGLTAGDTFVALRLPFGSFTPNQPPLAVNVSLTMSNLADLGVPLTIQARGGYQYGYNPLNDFCCGDNPTLTLSPWDSGSVTPSLFTVTKTYNGPEDETATGPNFLRRYTITAEIAPGQTLTSFTLTDILPDNMQFFSLISPLAGCAPPSTVIPGGVLSCNFASASGTVSMTFEYYISLRNAGGASVIDPDTGNDALSCNNASGGGTWTPVDSRDLPASTQTINQGGCEHTLTDKSIATQKNVAVVGGGQAAPGRTLEYTLDVQISDFFAFDQVVLTDTFSDGQRWDTTFAPTLQIAGNPAGLNSSGNFNVANYTVDISQIGNTGPAPDGTDGSTTITFRISDEMILRSADGRLIGGCVPATGTGGGDPNCGAYNNGATTARLIFRTVIQENFSDTYTSGDPSVDQGDVLNNIESVNGRVLDTDDALTPTGSSEADGSAASVSIGRGTLTKSVYAVNNSTSYPSPIRVTAGDTVTYRVQYTLVTSDFEDLELSDYLPLPIFNAIQVAPPFNNTVCGIPTAGSSCLGPNDTYHSLPAAIVPNLTTDAGNNRINWAYGDYDSTVNTPSTIDILFTVTVRNDPFADNMHLTNQAYATEGSTNGIPGEAASIVEITLTEPVMTTTKSMVATDNPSPTFTPALPVAFTAPGSGPVRWTGTINSNLLESTPIDSNVSGLDAGDLVTFSILLVNQGSGIKGAFDIAIRDVFDAAGFEFPTPGDPASLNLQIYYGNGTGPIPYTDLTDSPATADALFGAGIKLVDPPGGDGVCQAHDPVDGNNVIVITYDLRLRSDIVPGTYVNTGTMLNYSASEGGPNFLPQPESDDATVTTDNPILAKTLTGTEFNSAANTNTQAVIGELATYVVTTTIPEGQMENARIVDTLDSGLAFVSCDSIAFSSDLSTSLAGGLNAACNAPTNPSLNPTGQTVTFDLGNLVNVNRDNNVPETITITYKVVTLNVLGNQSGTQLNNSARLSWTGGILPAVSAENITVIEPNVNITKTAANLSPLPLDAGDQVEYTIVVVNPGPVDAFDVLVSDTFPPQVDPATLTVHSVTDTAGALTLADFSFTGSTLTNTTLFDMPASPVRTVTIVVRGSLILTLPPGQTITNTARAAWTSLDGDFSADRSGYNTNSEERSGTDGPGAGLNNYAKDSSIVLLSSATISGTKSLVVTSEPGTLDTVTPPRITIGEIVRYRVAILIPQGQAPDLSILDNLPTGLVFLNDGTAKAAFVTNNGGITSSSVVPGDPGCANLNVSGNAVDLASLPSANINCPLNNAAVSNSRTSNTDAYVSGTDVYFKFGTVTNSDNDADNEYIVIEFNALAMNITANQGNNNLTGAITNTNRDNGFTVRLNTTTTNTVAFTSPSDAVRVMLAEPAIVNLNKVVSPASGDAGDTFTYTVTFSNVNTANASPAYDVIFRDTVPVGMSVVPLTLNVVSACALGTDISNTAGNNIDVRFSELPVNCAVSITYQAQLLYTVNPNQILTNAAAVTYTSLPLANGTSPNPTGSITPGAVGSDTGERTGTSGQGADGTFLNNYRDVDAENITVNTISYAKSLASSSDPNTADPGLAIGETVRFRLAVSLPEGSAPNFTVTDNLPGGLRFLDDGSARFAFVSNGVGLASSSLACANVTGSAADLVSLPSASVSCLLTGAISGGPFVDGTDPVFSLGNLSNNDSDIDAEYVIIEFNARLVNALAYQNGYSAANTFVVSIGGTSLPVSNSVSVAVIEPVITIDKSLASISAEVDAGGTANYSVILQNTGTAMAHNVRVQDTLPAVLQLNIASIQVDGVATPGASAGNLLDLTITSIPVGGSATITYSATILGAITPDQLVNNVAAVFWTSQPGDIIPGSPDGERDGSGGVNDYTTNDNATFTSASFAAAKSFTTNQSHTTAGNVAVGEIVIYDVSVSLPEGTTSGLVVTDNLPLGLQYVSGSASLVTTGFNGSINPADPTVACAGTCASGDDLTFTFVNPISTAGDNDTTNNSFIIRYQALLLNDSGVNSGNNLTNTVTATIGAVNRSDAETVIVVEPQLSVTKSADNTTWVYGQTVTYTIQLAHLPASNADAFDIIVTDTIPAGLTYVPGSISAPAGWATNDAGAPTLGWTCNAPACSMPLGGPVNLTYDVTVNPPSTPPFISGNTTLTNTAAATWTSLPGSDTGERDGSDGEGGTPNDYADSETETGGLDSYYALGNRVWFDTNNNSQIDFGSEQGVDGVTVDLYAASDLSTILATDTTTNGGYYLFDYLQPGDYVVVIPNSNFAAGAALAGSWSSATSRLPDASLTETGAPDPDDDADSDDNGTRQPGGAVISMPVTIGAPEPLAEADLEAGVGQGAQPDARANLTVDFGFYKAAIGNQVYRDDVLDGRYVSGDDTPLNAVTVQLLSGDGLTVLDTTTTNASGFYQFNGQPEGDYIVRVSTPTGMVSTIDTFNAADTTDPDVNADHNDNGIGIGLATSLTVQSGVLTMTAGDAGAQTNNTFDHVTGTTTDPTVDFGFVYAYGLGNRVWYDTDNSSTINGAEIGVDGVTVQLYAADGSGNPVGPVLSTDLTANGGYYLFDDLNPGDYVVVIPASNFVSVLEGYWSSATSMLSDGTTLETAAPGPNNDVDRDDNGTLQTSGDVISLVVTLGPTANSEPTTETDLDGGSQGAQPNERANMTVDFGFYRVSVGNLVWADADRDGQYDSGEPFFSGLTVNLYASDGTTLLDTTTTDANGEYIFTELPAGTYIVAVDGPAGTFSTVDTADGADTADPNANTDHNDNGVGVAGGTVYSNPVTLTPGDAQINNAVTNSDGTTHNPTLDFGFTPVYSLGNRVWFDTNNNRLIDFASEVGRDGVSVQLFDISGTEILVGPDGVLGTADDAAGGMLTTNGGYYLFNGLEAGEYLVVIPASNFSGGAALAGYWSSGKTRANDGSLSEIASPDPDNDLDSDDNGMLQNSGVFTGAVISQPVSLGPTFVEPLNESDLDVTGQGQPDSQANMTVDFGFYTMELGNQVWNDVDNSGALDGAELGINAVTVQLWSADGSTLLATTTTSGGGFYTFTGLPQGSYIVRLPESNFIAGGVLRNYYSSTGAGSEPAPNPDFNLTDSDDNGTQVGLLGFAGGYIQTGIFAVTPAGEQSLDHNLGLTTEFRVDFGVFNSPLVDLAVSKTDNQSFYLPGGTLTYTIVVTNNGPADLVGATVSDDIPVQIESWSWACTTEAGGASGCTPYTGPGNFSDVVDLPFGGSITYTVTANLAADATGALTNTVIVAPPTGYADSDGSNNTAQDVDQPASLTITKDDGLTVVAPGSLVTYTIVLTNNGAVDLTSITVEDTLPADVTYQSANPAPTSVTGNLISWSGLSLAVGANATFTITVQVNLIPAGGNITNVVTVEDTNTGQSDSDDDTDLVAANNGKLVIATNQATTAPPQTAIGEIVTYQIRLDIPALSTLTNLRALDVLDSGLAFVRCVRIDPGALTTTLPGGFVDACNAPVNPTVLAEPLGNTNPVDQGRRVLFNFGDVTNPDAADAGLIVEYEVVLLNTVANQDGVGGLKNTATWTWDGGTLVATAPPLEIVEPDMSITKDATPTVAPYGSPITFGLDIAHTVDSTTDAFDVVVTDILPPGLAFIPGTVVVTGLAPDSIDYNAATTTLTFTWNQFPLTATSLITFETNFVGPAPTINTADLAWTSLPIDPGLQQSDYNIHSTERWYDPPSTAGLNTYGASSSATITVPVLPATGFAPGRVTSLPAQPVEKAYNAMDGMWIEIPDLGLTLPILGVPISSEGWDLTWLSTQAGYLDGTTLPGNIGTTGLTAHVTLADGTPGPFRNLNRLYWGNKVILHADGYRYTYEVRESRTVLPRDLSVLKKDGYTWLTLITCEGYVPWLDSYNYRLAVRAVLLSVEPDGAASPFPAQNQPPVSPRRGADR